ncbi:hypothetical protein M3202_21465 [Alkalihalobacillus oceani]|uniref:Alkyl hydroperoxide reductase subunit C/ Thiol specific antioxidant domain-containing protein n=1 Tax=Halalkalibacter oceani TaxID=1653776 RepID=A0A9X2IQ14_9BACI|nr:hypothetical protein [Halalkalibacter oceani]MCM3716614.1 hypothetical protein [Halalkalibacter oceani]
MKKWRMKTMIGFLALFAMMTVLVACGTEEEQAGDLTLVNEQGEEVTLSNKDRATILFHFTEVG